MNQTVLNNCKIIIDNTPLNGFMTLYYEHAYLSQKKKEKLSMLGGAFQFLLIRLSINMVL